MLWRRGEPLCILRGESGEGGENRETEGEREQSGSEDFISVVYGPGG